MRLSRPLGSTDALVVIFANSLHVNFEFKSTALYNSLPGVGHDKHLVPAIVRAFADEFDRCGWQFTYPCDVCTTSMCYSCLPRLTRLLAAHGATQNM
jgi:hypothetical protein